MDARTESEYRLMCASLCRNRYSSDYIPITQSLINKVAEISQFINFNILRLLWSSVTFIFSLNPKPQGTQYSAVHQWRVHFYEHHLTQALFFSGFRVLGLTH